MTNKYALYTEDGSSLDRGLLMTAFPENNFPGEEVNYETIPGREGSLVVHTGTYPDWTITLHFEFIVKQVEDYESVFRDHCKWLRNAEHISFTDAPDLLYRVKKVDILDIVRDEDVVGDFTCMFTVWPGTYLADGMKEQSFDGTRVVNQYDFCKPIYKIVGEGECELSVNDVSMVANVGQNLTIDTELMLAYRTDGTLMNTSVSGDYEDLWLQEGENTVTITNGFTLTVIPRWRYLA